MHAILARAIEDLYIAFGAVPRPRAVVGCPCCTKPGEFDSLTVLPLRAIPAEAIHRYGYSAIHTVGSVEDLRYLFPRLIEVVAQDPEGITCLEIALSKPRVARWEAWPEVEQEGLRTFAASIGRWLAEEVRPHYEVSSWICGLGQYMPDVVPSLMPLLNPTPAAMANLVSFYQWNQGGIKRGALEGAFWEDSLPAWDPLLAWLRSDTFGEALGQAYLSGAAG
jgi:hypothetical protein